MVAVMTVGGVLDDRVAIELDTISVQWLFICLSKMVDVQRVLTVIPRWHPVLLKFLLFLYFFYNLIKQIIKKLVCVLVHARAE